MKFVNEVPVELRKENPNGGVVERFEYAAKTHDELNRPVTKGAWVYLPKDYSEDKQYNILYLMHGGGVTEDWWFKTFPETKNIVDNMIEQGLCKPCIIVTPTFYTGSDLDKNAEVITENFKFELRNELIPAVESKYSTYANKDVDIDNLIATRDHRAFGGLSLGSMTTYRAAFYSNYDLFAWYAPYSGCCGPKGIRTEEVARIIETLSNGYGKGLPLKYMLCCNGDKDIAYEEHIEIMEKAYEKSEYLNEGINYHMHVIPGGVHDMKEWQTDLLNTLALFFE